MNRYIVYNFNPTMVVEDKYVAEIKELDEAEFMHLATTFPYTSLVNDKGACKLFGFEYSKEYPKICKGDWILTVMSSRKIPEDGSIDGYTNCRFYSIEIKED